MEIGLSLYLSYLKSNGVAPLCAIWIVHDISCGGKFSVNVWDEIKNERVEDLEAGLIETYEEAVELIQSIVTDNREIKFVRLFDERV